MFNFLKKNQLKSDGWNKVLRSRILPESEYYYSEITTFDREFISKKISKTFSPHMSVDNKLNEGLYLSYAEFDDKVSTAYLQVSLSIANAILALPQSETERWNAENLYIDNYQPKINIYKLFLEALLNNEVIDTKGLIILNSSLLDYLKTQKGNQWEDVTQSNYLVCVWGLIIAGQFQDAKIHLNIKKKFSYVEGLFNWTVQINTLLIAQQSGDGVETELTQLFDKVFNIIRLPKWNTIDHQDKDNLTITMSADYVRFQLAVIRWLYIEKQPLKNHWPEVLGQVSK